MENTRLGGAEITALLGGWQKGDQDALNRVISLVYHDLRRMARYYLKSGNPAATLQATVLVHEVYQRLAGAKELVFENRAHFFNCACLIMRQIFVKYVGKQGAKDGEKERLRYVENDLSLEEFRAPDPNTLLALNQALALLGELDPRRSRIVELRFLSG